MTHPEKPSQAPATPAAPIAPETTTGAPGGSVQPAEPPVWMAGPGFKIWTDGCFQVGVFHDLEQVTITNTRNAHPSHPIPRAHALAIMRELHQPGETNMTTAEADKGMDPEKVLDLLASLHDGKKLKRIFVDGTSLKEGQPAIVVIGHGHRIRCRGAAVVDASTLVQGDHQLFEGGPSIWVETFGPVAIKSLEVATVEPFEGGAL